VAVCMCGIFLSVDVYMCGFCNVWFCNVRVCVYVGFVMYRCVYVWVCVWVL